MTKIIFKMQGFCKSGAQKSNKGNERIYRRISSAGWAETAGRVVMNKVSKLKGSEGFCFHWNTNELLTNLCITCPALPPVVSMYWHLFAIEPTRFWGERYALIATNTFSNLQKRHHLFPKNANQVLPWSIRVLLDQALANTLANPCTPRLHTPVNLLRSSSTSGDRREPSPNISIRPSCHVLLRNVFETVGF